MQPFEFGEHRQTPGRVVRMEKDDAAMLGERTRHRRRLQEGETIRVDNVKLFTRLRLGNKRLGNRARQRLFEAGAQGGAAISAISQTGLDEMSHLIPVEEIGQIEAGKQAHKEPNEARRAI
ncbi:hypothetical protein [Caballeronia cordobensis]|uniref:hypothetical protein n=1 Tax=Caballeronia cordobensis TaxID=1353886 RepID=UPI001F1DAEDF|nr:hypothetical protein [Caballeronia cordobensis]